MPGAFGDVAAADVILNSHHDRARPGSDGRPWLGRPESRGVLAGDWARGCGSSGLSRILDDFRLGMAIGSRRRWVRHGCLNRPSFGRPHCIRLTATRRWTLFRPPGKNPPAGRRADLRPADRASPSPAGRVHRDAPALPRASRRPESRNSPWVASTSSRRPSLPSTSVATIKCSTAENPPMRSSIRVREFRPARSYSRVWPPVLRFEPGSRRALASAARIAGSSGNSSGDPASVSRQQRCGSSPPIDRIRYSIDNLPRLGRGNPESGSKAGSGTAARHFASA